MTGTTITSLQQPGSIIDPLIKIAREGARQMLMVADKAEAASFVAQFSEELLPDGRQRIVRHRAGPELAIQTGIGPITAKMQVGLLNCFSRHHSRPTIETFRSAPRHRAETRGLHLALHRDSQTLRCRRQ